MTSRRTILTTIAAATLAFGAIAVAAPSASAAPSEDTTTCTVEQRTELRTTIADLKSRIAERRLTAEERAAKQAERDTRHRRYGDPSQGYPRNIAARRGVESVCQPGQRL